MAVRFLHAVAVVLPLAALMASPFSGAWSRGKFPPDDTLDIPSLTLTDSQFLRGAKAAGTPVTLTGELRFPSWDEHLPAVVLLHGSDGQANISTFRWRDFLNGMGVATFRVDSFAGRGVVSVETDQSQLGSLVQVYDAYRAVEVLAADPRIDPSRIAIMGFSRGGVAALYASLNRFQGLYGPVGVKIAAYLPFYPACNFAFIEELDVADAPIREFHGAADDWVLAAPCRDYITRLAAAGKDAAMMEFAGAFHAFDNPGNALPQVLSTAQTSRNCQRKEVDGVIVNAATGQPFSYSDACVELGPTVKYDKAATEAAEAAVKDFLTRLFKVN